MRTYEANGAGDRLHIDLTGPHPVSRQGHIYIFTAIDAYTRYLIAVPLRNKTAVSVANALVEHVFLPHGSYRSILSDQGREFCNEVLDEVTRLLGVEKLRTSAYRASANGRVERVHRTMNALLCKIVSENQRDWAERLPMVIAAYNAAHHETTEYSPYYLMFGREYRTPLDLTLNIPEEASPVDMGDYAAQLRERIQTAYEVVNQHLHTKTERMKKRYDAKVHSFLLQPGEFVLYYCPRRKQGRYQKWRRLCTICRVENRMNDVLYSIRTSPRAKLILAHIDRLRRYEGDVPSIWKSAPAVTACQEALTCSGSKNQSPVSVMSNVEDIHKKQTSSAAEATVAQTRGNTGKIDTGAQQGEMHRQPELDTGAQRNVTHRRFEPGASLDCTQTGRIARPQRARRPPARYRQLYHDGSIGSQSVSYEMNETIVSSDIEDNMSNGATAKVSVTVDASQREPRPRAPDGSRLHRRQRERGPWFCMECDRPPMGDITTFRRHMVLQHNQYYSWSGHTRPFADEIEAERVREVIGRAGRHSVSNSRVGSRHPYTRESTSLRGTVDAMRGCRRLRRGLSTVRVPVSSTSQQTSLIPVGSVDRSGATATTGQFASEGGLSDFSDVEGLLQSLGALVPMATEFHGVVCQTASPQERCRTMGIQTPTGEPIQLPAAWSVRRLTELAMSQPQRSPRELALFVSRQHDTSIPMAQFDNVILVLEAHAETVRQMIVRVEGFHRHLVDRMGTGQPWYDVQRQFEIWVGQLQSRAYDHYGPLLEPASANSTETEDTTASTSRVQTARRGRRPTSSSTRSRFHFEEESYRQTTDGDTEPEDWGSDDPYL